MDAVIENLPTFCRRLPHDPAPARGRPASARSSSAPSSRRCASRRCASLRGFATVYTELLRNTPLTLVLFFCAFVLPYLGVAARLRRSLAIIGAHALHLAVRRRGAALGHQRRPGRAGRGGAQHRARLRPDASSSSSCRRRSAWSSRRSSTSHRPDQEHLGRRRLLRRRAVRRRRVSSSNANGNAVIAILLARRGLLPRSSRCRSGSSPAHLEKRVAVQR